MTEKHIEYVAILGCVFAFLAFVVGGSSIIVTVALHNRENINGRRITEGEFRLCERLNRVRHQSNDSNWVEWLQLKQSAARSYVLAATDSTTRMIRLRGAKEYEELATRLTWTPLTNCYGAVYHPYTYKAPGPSSFTNKNLRGAPSDKPLG